MPAKETLATETREELPNEMQLVVSTPGFATYIDVYSTPGEAALNAQLLDVIAEWRAREKGMDASNQLGWHSPRSLFKRNDPAFLKLFGHIDLALMESVRRSWQDFDPIEHIAKREGWVNVNGKGAFNVPHDHYHYHYSGVYYIAVRPGGAGRSGLLEFLSPLGVVPPPLPRGA